MHYFKNSSLCISLYIQQRGWKWVILVPNIVTRILWIPFWIICVSMTTKLFVFVWQSLVVSDTKLSPSNYSPKNNHGLNSGDHRGSYARHLFHTQLLGKWPSRIPFPLMAKWESALACWNNKLGVHYFILLTPQVTEDFTVTIAINCAV